MLRRSGLLIVVTASTILVISAMAVVAATVEQEALHVCVGPQGRLREAPTCRSNETAHALAASGAPQPAAGHEVVQALTPIDSNPFKTAVAFCPDGKQVIGGGVNGVPWNEHSAIVIDAPNHAGERDESGKLIWDRWEGRAFHTGGESWRLQVLAICAYVE